MFTSVALCTFNGEKYIAFQLQSILEQTVAVNEIIICDDCSTDNTISIINSFARSYPGIIAVHINDRNLGGRKNFEKALKLCSGDFIFFSDQDDIWMKNKVERILTVFNSNHTCKGIFTNATLIDEKSNPLSSTLLDHTFFKPDLRKNYTNSDLLYWSLLLGNIVTGATIAIRRTALDDVLPFHLNFKRKLWHDAWIGYVLLLKQSMQYLDECLIQYRVHPKQQVGINTEIGGIFEAVIIKKSSDTFITLRELFQKYLITYLFIQQFLRVKNIANPIVDRVINEYQLQKRRYFISLPFLQKKLRLFKWYIKSINDISFKDLISL
jgi:glycosyltransferase involved in cell wall biosynthesis